MLNVAVISLLVTHTSIEQSYIVPDPFVSKRSVEWPNTNNIPQYNDPFVSTNKGLIPGWFADSWSVEYELKEYHVTEYSMVKTSMAGEWYVPNHVNRLVSVSIVTIHYKLRKYD